MSVNAGRLEKTRAHCFVGSKELREFIGSVEHSAKTEIYCS